MIRRPDRTPRDYFAEFRAYVWTRDPDKYTQVDLDSWILVLEEEFGNAQTKGGEFFEWVNSTIVRRTDVPELQIRDQVDEDEAENPLDDVGFHVGFWKVKDETRDLQAEYFGTLARCSPDPLTCRHGWRVKTRGYLPYHYSVKR